MTTSAPPLDLHTALDLQTTLGRQRLVEVDRETGRAVIEFLAGPHMCHSGGVVQGGFVCGWIDAAMAQAAMARAGDHIAPLSLELKVSFLAPARPGLVTAEAWVERMGRTNGFLEGRLLNAAGDVVAKASSTVRLVPRAEVEARARAEIE
ncbi:MAG TPA: PaaI family thioesterase [Caulobacteraceae bacterium]|jgi:uncharacterized protein (TIGR00369 family)|nr:PaaI family thioesterase [Caulobacteraceae bacterium]